MRRSKGVDDVFRMKIIEEHLSGSSKYSLARKYKLKSGQLITDWMRKFGVTEPENEAVSEEIMKKRKSDMNKSVEVIALEKENKNLKLRLAKAEMKAEALDVMIDLAEEAYQISVRKNSNTKQS